MKAWRRTNWIMASWMVSALCVSPVGGQEEANRPVALDQSMVTVGRCTIEGFSGFRWTKSTAAKRPGREGLRAAELVTPPAHGRVAPGKKPGQLVYRPDEGFVGIDTFTYCVVSTGGVASAPATVTMDVRVEGEGRYSEGLQFEPPPHLVRMGAATNRLFKLGYLDVTWYDGWEGHPVDPTGRKDSTEGLQKAIDDAYDYQLAVFFPAGTYVISDMLRVVRKTQRFEFHNTTVIGSRAGARPTIRLMAGAPGFDDPKKPKPMMWIWTHAKDRRPFGTPGRDFDPSGDYFMNPGKGQRWDAVGFDQTIDHLAFDCNGINGNAGAIGLRFGGAQGSSLRDIKVIATGAFAGVYDIPSRSSAGAGNVDVEGGRYGLYLNEGASSVIVGAVLRNQTEAAIYSSQCDPIAVAGFHIVKDNGPVIAMSVMGGFYGSISLMDGVIDIQSGGPAFDNGKGRSLYMRNVYVKGADKLITTPRGAVTGQGAWKRIREYGWADQSIPGKMKGKSFLVPAMMVNGKVGGEEIADVESSAPPPPADFVSRHVWDRLPSFEDPDCAVLTEVSAADGSDEADDGAEIQKALDTHQKVFVPKGVFYTGRTLTLGRKNALFGVGRPTSRIVTHPGWKPTEATPVIQTADDAKAKTGSFSLG